MKWLCLLFLACAPVLPAVKNTNVTSQANPANPNKPNITGLQLFVFLPPTPPTECPEVLKIDSEITSASTFVDTLALCKRPVVIEIDSPGGSLFAALDMQKAIERHPYKTTCVVDGRAASAAFVTLQSCSVRLMTSRSVLMMHHASINNASGQSHELQNAAGALVALDRAAVLQVSKRLDITPEELECKIHSGREWWMASDEATEYSAIDGIADSVQAEAAKLPVEKSESH